MEQTERYGMKKMYGMHNSNMRSCKAFRDAVHYLHLSKWQFETKEKLKKPSKEEMEAMEDRFASEYAVVLSIIAKEIYAKEQQEKKSQDSKPK